MIQNSWRKSVIFTKTTSCRVERGKNIGKTRFRRACKATTRHRPPLTHLDRTKVQYTTASAAEPFHQRHPNPMFATILVPVERLHRLVTVLCNQPGRSFLEGLGSAGILDHPWRLFHIEQRGLLHSETVRQCLRTSETLEATSLSLS